MQQIRDGFAPHDRKSPVTDAWEPLYSSREGGTVRLAIVLGQQHCNGRGMLHGGVIAAMADNAMGLSLGAALQEAGQDSAERGPAKGIVTASLAVDFIGVATPGQWIEVIPRVVSIGRSSGVTDALIEADGVIVARANASFRVLR